MTDFNYTPNSQQLYQLELLQKIAEACQAAGIDYWITGGYAYDVMYGELTRDHGDFDFFVHEASAEKFISVVESLGFELHKQKYKEDSQTTLYVYYLNDLKLEFVLIREQNGEYFFGEYKFAKQELPNDPIGSLAGVKINTPTLAAHQRLDSLVDRGSYIHSSHRAELRERLTKSL